MKAFSCLMILVAVLAAASPAASEVKRSSKHDVIRKEKKLEDVKRQIREEQKSVRTITEKETNILGDLEDINKKLVARREELGRAQAGLGEIQKKVDAASFKIDRLERQRQDLSARLKSRLRAMYKMRRGEYMSLIFASESPQDLGRRHKYLTIIMDSDSRLIAGYEKTLADLEAEKRSLSGLYAEMGKSRSEALAKRNEALELQRQKTAFLSDIKKEKVKHEKVISELEEAAAGLKDLLGKLRAEEEKEKPELKEKEEVFTGTGSGFGAMRGKLRMPVEGTVVSFYGKVSHPKFKTVTFNNGIVIEAPAGAPVKSVYDGKVIYVGWLKGYGQVLIMDNGGGFYTLYANLSKVLKDKGQTAEKGVEVGLVGDTGASSAPGLYFEIRQKGIPRDPMAWFAGR